MSDRRTDREAAERAAAELDRALTGDPAAEPELALLVADVRASRSAPDETFVAELDRRVASRFAEPGADPVGGTRAARAPRRRLVWRLAPAGALLAGLAAVVVVTTGGGERDTVSSLSTAGDAAAEVQSAPAAPEAAADEALRFDGGGGAAAAPVSPQARTVAPPSGRSTGPRSVQRAAELTLTPAVGDVQEVADGVVRTTQALGGYVQRSDVDVRDDAAEASLVLRVPSAKLDDALARLARLAEVGALRQESTDITGAVESAQARLSDARAERRALLRALGRAATDREIRSLRARLADNRRRIARDEAALDAQRRRASLATVAVTVTGTEDAGGDEDEGGAWTPGDALGDAWRILQVAGGVLIVALAAGAPLLLLALLGRLALRRRREAVLDT